MKCFPAFFAHSVLPGLWGVACVAPVHVAWREVQHFEDGVCVHVDDAAVSSEREASVACRSRLACRNAPRRDREARAAEKEGVEGEGAEGEGAEGAEGAPGRAAAGFPACLSTRARAQYDCRDRRFGSLPFVSFAGQMGDGAEVGADRAVGRWESVSDGAMEEKPWHVACGASGAGNSGVGKQDG